MVGWFTFAGFAHAADVDLFDPAASFASGRGTPQGEAPDLVAPGFVGGAIGAWTRNPVSRTFPGYPSEVVVAELVPVTVQAGWTVGQAMRFDVLFPAYVWVDAPYSGYTGQAAGDLRFQATIPIGTGDVAAALVPRVGVPTGTTGAPVTRGSWESLTLALGGRNGIGGYVVNLGLVVASDTPLEPEGTALGSSADGLAGVWLGVDLFRIGAEVDLDVGLASADRSNLTSAGHAFVQSVLPNGVGLAGGAGTGLIAGIGTPELRVFGALTYTSKVRDLDADGIVDKVDPCPTVAEDRDGFEDADGCPDFDNDGDHRLDVVDQCPDEAEDIDGFGDPDGCPDRDNDGDGIDDDDDRCRDIRGSIPLFGCPDTDGDGLADPDDGCPRDAGPLSVGGCPDRDGDQVPDVRDVCPSLGGTVGDDPATSDGCPRKAWVVASEIRVTDRVDFDPGRASITPGSFPSLDGVARVLAANPGIRRLEVQAHTDDVGEAPANLALSSKRAAAVVAYLEMRGVEAARLTARGYGETVPLFTNRTPKGRDGNRRIQFVILDGAADPPAPRVVAPKPVPVVPASLPSPIDGPPGTLSVTVAGGDWATIFVDGRKLQRAAPFTDVPIPAGRHTIRAENPRLGLGWEITVDVAPEQRVKLVVPRP